MKPSLDGELKLIVLVGMPGSGKTTYAKKLVERGLIDNYCDDYEVGPLKRNNPEWREADLNLVKGLKSGEKWAIADTRYCDPIERKKMVAFFKAQIPNLAFNFIYFENSPEKCQINAARRKGSLPRHEINLIYYYTNLYEIPSKSNVEPIKTDW